MKATPSQYAKEWHEALRTAEPQDWDAIGERMLRRLVREGQLKSLPEITKLVESLTSAAKAMIDVTVTSAHQLDDKMVKQVLKQLLGDRELNVTRRIDPALIGGMVVQTKDDRWDLSIKEQLRRLQREINV